MDVFDDSFLNLIKILQHHEVEYIFVGGLATNLNGFNRFTADVDVWIKDEISNRKKLRKAIFELGLGDLPMIETTQFIPGWSALTLESGVELDIMTTLIGLEKYSFDEVYENCPTFSLHGLNSKFLHINFLIENKMKVNRPKDQIDILELKEIKKRNEGN